MRPTVLIAVGAAIGALAVAAAPAAAAATPQPLWHAYPLDNGARTVATSTNGQGAEAAVARRQGPRAAVRRAPAAAPARGRSPVQAIVIGVLAGLAFALAGVLAAAARGPLSRRLEEARAVRPEPAAAIDPKPEPVAMLPAPPDEAQECEIVWWTRGADAQFRAVGRNRAGRRYVAARSPAVADPRPPLRQGETLEAWEALVEHLQKRGWTPHGPAPHGNGTPWYAQRFERPRRPERSPAPATGDRA